MPTRRSMKPLMLTRRKLIKGAAALVAYSQMEDAGAQTTRRVLLLSGSVFKAPKLPTNGLVARYIAGLGVTTPGGAVTQWNDQIGTNHIVTAGGTVTNPTVLGRPLIRFAGGSNLTLPSSLSFNNRNCSVFLVCRNYNAYNPQTGNPAPTVIFAAGTAASNTTLYWSNSNFHEPVVYRDSANATMTPAIDTGFGITLLGVVAGASTVTVIQGGETSSASLGSSNVATGGFINQFTTASPFSNQTDVYDIIIYNRTLTVPEIAQVQTFYKYYYGTQPNADTFFTVNGDSQTVAQNLALPNDNQWPFQMASLGVYAPKFLNMGVSGTVISQMNTAAGTVSTGSDSYLTTSTGYTNRLNILDGGTNDIWMNGNSAATVQASITTYRTNRIAAGWSAGNIWHVPIRPRGQAGNAPNPTYEATRNTVNAWLVANFPTTTFSGLLSHPAWSANDATNLTWYQSDQVHMTIAGYAAQSTIQYAALKAAGLMA